MNTQNKPFLLQKAEREQPVQEPEGTTVRFAAGYTKSGSCGGSLDDYN